jgi:multicomponent Na+:H+ antiporter subunit B
MRRASMNSKEVVIGVSTALLLVVLVAVVLLGGTAHTPSSEIRPLAKFYLENCFNVFDRTWWTASPEAVTSMLWDYRGIDTYYETSVFFLAIIGAVALFRVVEVKLKAEENERRESGLSIIVKSSTRIIFPLILVVSASVAFHGHLTPGGGFQAGSILAVGPLLLIAAFSRRYLEEHLRFSRDKFLVLRSVGLILIVLVIALPLAAGAALMLNQPKPWLPAYIFPVAFDPVWTSGTLFFFNVAEFLAVGAGFTLLFLLLSIPEEEFKRVLGI